MVLDVRVFCADLIVHYKNLKFFLYVKEDTSEWKAWYITIMKGYPTVHPKCPRWICFNSIPLFFSLPSSHEGHYPNNIADLSSRIQMYSFAAQKSKTKNEMKIVHMCTVGHFNGRRIYREVYTPLRFSLFLTSFFTIQ